MITQYGKVIITEEGIDIEDFKSDKTNQYEAEMEVMDWLVVRLEEEGVI